jgi:hypothetical protein
MQVFAFEENLFLRGSACGAAKPLRKRLNRRRVLFGDHGVGMPLGD